MKRCTKCGQIKPVSEFNKHKGRGDGLASLCKLCKRAADRRYYISNAEKLKKKTSDWATANPERKKAAAKEYYQSHGEKIRARTKKYAHAHPEKRKQQDWEYYKANRKKILGMAETKARAAGMLPHSERWPVVMIKCGNCGKAKRVSPSSVKKTVYGKNFCCYKCYGEWRAKAGINTGEDNYLWMGGISFEPYGQEFNTKLKNQIRDRDERTCQVCGMHEAFFSDSLCVHHIDYDKKNNAPENLISLCRTCHSMTNGRQENREKWEQYFSRHCKTYASML